MKNILLILVLLFSNTLVQGQGKDYQNPNSNLKKGYLSYLNKYETIKAEFREAKNVADYLPIGYSKKGDVDYTKYLQTAIDRNEDLVFPDFPIMISPRGLKLKRNSRLFFLKGSQLIIKPNSLTNYQALLIDGVSNVEIYFASIKGDRFRHKGSDGQWGMGIWINNSQNISIYGTKVVECWGDGIYIGNRNRHTSSNILIDGGIFDNNRRNGISIISGKNITVKNSLLSNANGQNPRSGIDIEPNTNADILEEITLDGITTFNNGIHGIIVSLGNLDGISRKNVSIIIDNHKDFGSAVGLGFSLTKPGKSRSSNLTGAIDVKNSFYNNPKNIFIKNYKGKRHLININFSNVSLKNSKGTRSFEGLKKKFLEDYRLNVDSEIR